MTDGGKLSRGKVVVEVSAEKNQYIMNIQHIQFKIQLTKGIFCSVIHFEHDFPAQGQELTQEIDLLLLRLIHSERRRKLSLMFVVYSLIFLAFTPAFTRCEQALGSIPCLSCAFCISQFPFECEQPNGNWAVHKSFGRSHSNNSKHAPFTEFLLLD